MRVRGIHHELINTDSSRFKHDYLANYKHMFWAARRNGPFPGNPYTCPSGAGAVGPVYSPLTRGQSTQWAAQWPVTQLFGAARHL